MWSLSSRIGLCGVIAALSAPAHALSVTVTPAEHRVQMDAGSTETRSLAVTNNGAGEITISAYAWDWWYKADGSHQFGPPGTLERSGSTWVSMVPEKLVIAPGTTGHFEVHVSMPDRTTGGYYAVAFLEARSGTPWSEGFGMRPGARVAVPMLMEASGTPTHEMSLLDAEVTPPSDTQPLTISLKSRNSGDTHEFPEFMGAIRSIDNQEIVARFRGKPTRMLPGQERIIEASWSGGLPPGSYEVIGSLVYGGGKNAFVQEQFTVDYSDAVSDWAP